MPSFTSSRASSFFPSHRTLHIFCSSFFDSARLGRRFSGFLGGCGWRVGVLACWRIGVLAFATLTLTLALTLALALTLTLTSFFGLASGIILFSHFFLGLVLVLALSAPAPGVAYHWWDGQRGEEGGGRIRW